MSAHVQSVRAIAEFRAALCTFMVEARQALAAIEMEARRAVEYITHEQAQAWNHEVRRGRENVQQCKLDIHNTRTFKRIGHYRPSCIDEKKELDKAQRRLHLAEAKVEAVRHWGRVAEQAFREFHTRLTQFTSLLDGEMPKAVGALERVLAALDRYLAVEAPAAAAAVAVGGGASYLTRLRRIASSTGRLKSPRNRAKTRARQRRKDLHAAPHLNRFIRRAIGEIVVPAQGDTT